ncbi:Hypothetical protein CAP_2745 [Chondromyces apiculatus DSM 436]|uniref:Uncharacterized protein n=1 Tax=Chondromyces apiculatus DSM 436 TaxID=1192034 RepID=A0A017TI04_9BACT|nr:Hypothetical protein CAP_2745 [Chondromyces apiculatus DSM 436]
MEVVAHLVEGASIRATSRLTGVSKPAILSLLLRMGEGCSRLHDRLVRDIDVRDMQADEIGSYVQKKQARVTRIPRMGTPDVSRISTSHIERSEGVVDYGRGCRRLWVQVLSMRGEGVIGYGCGCYRPGARVLSTMGEGVVGYGCRCYRPGARVLSTRGEGVID